MEYEYIKIQLSITLLAFIEQYNLTELVHTDDYVYTEVRGGMYGLPQAGRLAYDDLIMHMEKAGYRQENSYLNYRRTIPMVYHLT